MKPFRFIALVLGLILALVLWGIFNTRTYEKELAEAKQAYTEAAKEHKELVSQLREQD